MFNAKYNGVRNSDQKCQCMLPYTGATKSMTSAIDTPIMDGIAPYYRADVVKTMEGQPSNTQHYHAYINIDSE